MKTSQNTLLEKLHELEPGEFEELVAALWELQGWSTVVTPRQNDGGIDIIARQESPLSLRVALEAKRFEPGTTVRVKPVRELLGTAPQPEFNAVGLVTTGEFTNAAQEKNKESERLSLISGADLSALINQLDATPLVNSFVTTRDWDQAIPHAPDRPAHLTEVTDGFPVYTTDPKEESESGDDTPGQPSGGEPDFLWRIPLSEFPEVDDDERMEFSLLGINGVDALATANVDEVIRETDLDKDRVYELVRAAKQWDGGGVTSIDGIGDEYELQLKATGIETLKDLITATPEKVAAQIYPSASRVRYWCAEAAWTATCDDRILELLSDPDQPVTAIRDIGPDRASNLREAGVETVGDLATAEPGALADDVKFSYSTLAKWGQRARDLE